MFSDTTVTSNETYITVTKCISGACNAGKHNFKCEAGEACNIMLWEEEGVEQKKIFYSSPLNDFNCTLITSI
jgi:hypothetical protein